MMGVEALLWEILIEGVKYLVGYAISQNSDADGDTEISWGNFVSGHCEYYYTDENKSVSLETGSYSFSTGYANDLILVSGPHLLITATDRTGSTSLGVNAGTSIRWYHSHHYTINMEVNGITYKGSSYNTDNNYIGLGLTNSIPMYYYNGKMSGRNDGSTYYSPIVGYSSAVSITSISGVSERYPDAAYLPISGQDLSYNEVRPLILDWANQNLDESDETLTLDDIPTWEEAIGILYPTEPEETEPEETETDGINNSGCSCNGTTIYVNADGSLTLQNEVSGNMPITIDSQSDLTLSVNAAAGAFGAGAVVVDPDANINFGAGAFGAGAFGAGAISGDISISGDVTFEQSGTINNNYYYLQDPIEPETEQPFTLNYNEILSEGELESILSQETYDIVVSSDIDIISVSETIPADISHLVLLPSEVVTTSRAVVGYGSQIISDLGLMPIYVPLALFSCFCWMIRGGK